MLGWPSTVQLVLGLEETAILTRCCSFYFTGEVNCFAHFHWVEALLKNVNETLLDQYFKNMKKRLEFIDFTDNSIRTDPEKKIDSRLDL